MQRFLLSLLLFFGVFGLWIQAQARHIVGGEIRLEATITPGRYSLTLIQFWDENTLTTGNRDASAELLIYRKKDNVLVQKAQLPFVSSQNVSYQNKACAAFRSLRTTEGIYNTTILLNALDYNDPQGYFIIWERCCRNDDINNIMDPGSSGMVFYLEFPPLSVSNSSPGFSFPNGEYICKDQMFTMNMSATDADGDELRYSLVTPMMGNTTRNNPIGNDLPKSGYPLVEWSPGISLVNNIPGNPSLSIHNRSGILSVRASDIGLYVFTIQCDEYRNGKKIGAVRRDFQLLVIECNKNTPPEPIITYNKTKAGSIEFCSERPVILETDTSPDWSYQWQRNGLNIPGATNATITVQDTGSYTVVKSFRNQCSKDTASQIVKLKQATPPPVRLLADKSILCAGESTVLNTNANPSFSYQWAKNKVKLEGESNTIQISSGGMYSVKVLDNTTGCTAIDSLIVKADEIVLTLPDQVSIQKGKEVLLKPTVKATNAPVTYAWAPPYGLNSTRDSIVSASPDQSTHYILVITSSSGCSATDSVFVQVFDKLYIPDAFSPNGDGINDVFTIANGKGQIIEMKIFNRWGEVVFSSEGYETPWDGKYHSSLVPSGTYIYQIKTQQQIMLGSFLIIH